MPSASRALSLAGTALLVVFSLIVLADALELLLGGALLAPWGGGGAGESILGSLADGAGGEAALLRRLEGSAGLFGGWRWNSNEVVSACLPALIVLVPSRWNREDGRRHVQRKNVARDSGHPASLVDEDRRELSTHYRCDRFWLRIRSR